MMSVVAVKSVVAVTEEAAQQHCGSGVSGGLKVRESAFKKLASSDLYIIVTSLNQREGKLQEGRKIVE